MDKKYQDIRYIRTNNVFIDEVPFFYVRMVTHPVVNVTEEGVIFINYDQEKVVDVIRNKRAVLHFSVCLPVLEGYKVVID